MTVNGAAALFKKFPEPKNHDQFCHSSDKSQLNSQKKYHLNLTLPEDWRSSMSVSSSMERSRIYGQTYNYLCSLVYYEISILRNEYFGRKLFQYIPEWYTCPHCKGESESFGEICGILVSCTTPTIYKYLLKCIPMFTNNYYYIMQSCYWKYVKYSISMLYILKYRQPWFTFLQLLHGHRTLNLWFHKSKYSHWGSLGGTVSSTSSSFCSRKFFSSSVRQW